MDNFPIFLEIRNKPVLVIGGGDIALRKIKLLLKSKPNIKVIATNFCEEILDLKDRHSIDIIQKDIFRLGDEFNNRFDYIAEYTCYCAIDPGMRINYINIMYDLLREGGEFVGIFLPLNKDLSEGGPPFGIRLEETIELFCNKFKLIESISHSLSIEPRIGIEQFVRFIK